MLDWFVEDGLAYVVDKLRRDATRDYQFALTRYDVDRLVFVLGGTKEKPKPPTLPEILQSRSGNPRTR